MTKKQRLNLYKEALKDFESRNKNTDCFCAYFYLNHGLNLSRKGFIINLPELYQQKPETYQSYWWPEYDYEPRIKALRQAIKLCEQ